MIRNFDIWILLVTKSSDLRSGMVESCSLVMSRLATPGLVVALMTFMMTQQRICTICDPNLIAISSYACKKFKEPIRLQGCKILSFHWIRETVQIEVIIVRANFHVNISEQFTILSARDILSKGQ